MNQNLCTEIIGNVKRKWKSVISYLNSNISEEWMHHLNSGLVFPILITIGQFHHVIEIWWTPYENTLIIKYIIFINQI
jgi:hypothetical protein